MRSIKKEDLKGTIKLLKSIKFDRNDESKSTLFFPIESERTDDLDGLELVVKSTGAASKKELTPGIILVNTDDKKPEVMLAYANTDYCPKFDVIQYLDIVNGSISKGLKSFLNDHDVLLVGKEYISIVFNL